MRWRHSACWEGWKRVLVLSEGGRGIKSIGASSLGDMRRRGRRSEVGDRDGGWWFRSLRRSAVVDFDNATGGGDEEEYGEVIKRPSEEDVWLTELRTEGHSRGVLLSPSSTALSLHLVPVLSGSYEQARFPIQPPPSDKRLTVSYFPSHRKDWGIPDSIKSMNTNGSVNSPLSCWSWYEADASGSVDSRGMTTTCCFATSHLTLQGTCDIFA